MATFDSQQSQPSILEVVKLTALARSLMLTLQELEMLGIAKACEEGFASIKLRIDAAERKSTKIIAKRDSDIDSINASTTENIHLIMYKLNWRPSR